MKKITRLIITLLSSTMILSLGANAQLTNNGAQIVMGTGSYLVLNNLSLQNNGIFNQSAGTVLFTGNTNATIEGTTIPTFYTLQLNKPGASLQLQTPVTINDRLEFTSGLLDLNTKTITLGSTALLAGESETSHITGTTGGYVEITTLLNVPAAADPGQMGIIISSSENLGPVTIRRGHQSQTNGAGAGNSILRYYDIIPANNIALNATLRLNYLDAELNGLNENLLTMWKRNGTAWTDLGRVSNSTATNFVEESPINDFARFTLSVPNNTLPLVWSAFNTQCLSDKVRISWKTEQELNTSSFIIRRSSDARSWTTLTTLSATGNSNTTIDYSWTDPQPLAGTSYYQVQQKDIDGQMKVSPVLLNQCGSGDALKVFPNPVLSSCWVSVQSSAGGTVMMRLYDMKGRLVQQRRAAILAGNNPVELPMSHYAPGIYSLVITWPDGQIKVTKVEKH